MYVDHEIYQVSERIESVDDEDWYEYIVSLYDDQQNLLNEWNSRLETYSGVKDQRLSYEQALEAAQEIKEDVAAGEAPAWFDLDSN